MNTIDIGSEECAPRDFTFRRQDQEDVEAVFRRDVFGLSRYYWPAVQDLLRTIAETTDRPLILDIGAGIGASACFFALAYPMANIIAVEPDPTKIPLLRKNTELLRISVVHAAASDDRDFLQWQGAELVKASSGPVVRAVCIEDFFHGKAGVPFIVKLRAGAQMEAVWNARSKWFDRVPIIFCEQELIWQPSALPSSVAAATSDAPSITT